MKQLSEHNYSGIDATIIADSKSEQGDRITSFILTFPRIILAEFNTHRVLSRNSASSRAIPFVKMVEKVKENPFIPIAWMKDHSGMQGSEYFTDKDFDTTTDTLKRRPIIPILKRTYLEGRDLAVMKAQKLSELGLTKQIVNRGLEPYMWHTAICTATEYENFFALRFEGGAEIHISKLAEVMLEQYNLSEPKLLKPGEWHIPFGDMFDKKRLKEIDSEHTIHLDDNIGPLAGVEFYQAIKIMIATARCARVSYFNFEGKDDYEVDVKLHNRLSKVGHWSPFEHCARTFYKGELREGLSPKDTYSGNFRGFEQYRKMFDGENKSDPRVIQK